jgi:hypothetical protein
LSHLVALALGGWLLGAPVAPVAPARPWPVHDASGTIASRFSPPAGFRRVPAAPGSFAAFLRELPLRPEGTPVLLFDGRMKANQTAQAAVLDVDVGRRDLQQCADAVMRLRAEYLRSAGREDAICFRFTSGQDVPWSAWRDGRRPAVRGEDVAWSRPGKRDGSYASFRRYLDVIMGYAGTASLAKELAAVADPRRVEPGDVYIHGGFPGHAVIVVDVAEAPDGRRVFLAAQSYMPAQDPHVLRAPGSPHTPWFTATADGALVTPEWVFGPRSLRRFPDRRCASPP